uniref:Secreted protein n=1 Tax=Panagrellus redivivus TaxID=6233 RepID=A0A7E4V1R9_PANRE
MQPRTLYTLLLMLVILGSALGHGGEFKGKPLKRHMRELSNMRASIAKGIRRLFNAAEEYVLKTEEERVVGEKLIGILFPDQVIYKEHRDYPLFALCELIYGYIKVTPKENLNDLYANFLKVQHAVKEQLGVLL